MSEVETISVEELKQYIKERGKYLRDEFVQFYRAKNIQESSYFEGKWHFAVEMEEWLNGRKGENK